MNVRKQIEPWIGAAECPKNRSFCLGLQHISIIRLANTHKAVGAAVWLNENGIVLMGRGVLYVLFGFITNAGTPLTPQARKRKTRMKSLNVFELGTKPA